MAIAAPSHGRFPGEVRFIAVLILGATLLAGALGFQLRQYQWIALYAMGVALLAYALPLLRRHWVAAKWPQTQATVVSACVDRFRTSSEDEKTQWEYFPVVKFDFQLGSIACQSQRYSTSPADFSSARWGDAQGIVRSLQPGTVIDVHVCPTDPQWAVARAGAAWRRRSHLYAALLAGVVVTAIAVCLPWLMVA